MTITTVGAAGHDDHGRTHSNITGAAWDSPVIRRRSGKICGCITPMNPYSNNVVGVCVFFLVVAFITFAVGFVLFTVGTQNDIMAYRIQSFLDNNPVDASCSVSGADSADDSTSFSTFAETCEAHTTSNNDPEGSGNWQTCECSYTVTVFVRVMDGQNTTTTHEVSLKASATCRLDSAPTDVSSMAVMCGLVPKSDEVCPELTIYTHNPVRYRRLSYDRMMNTTYECYWGTDTDGKKTSVAKYYLFEDGGDRISLQDFLDEYNNSEAGYDDTIAPILLTVSAISFCVFLSVCCWCFFRRVQSVSNNN